jgi:hypothetical protein
MDDMGKWVWSKAIVVPGTAASSWTQLFSVSCRSAGGCSAGGYFNDANGHEGFVVDRKNGAWGKAKEVPSVAGFSEDTGVVSISCASAGNCAATGYDHIGFKVFVAAETNGVWGNAQELPGLSALTDTPEVSAISCAKAGTTCAIGGQYWDGDGFQQAFVTSP